MIMKNIQTSYTKNLPVKLDFSFLLLQLICRVIDRKALAETLEKELGENGGSAGRVLF